MPIGTPVVLTTDALSATQNSYATASVTPTAGNCHLLWTYVERSAAANGPNSVTGAGLTWTKIEDNANRVDGGVARRLALWQGVGTPTSGALTINCSEFETNCAWMVVDVPGASEAPLATASGSGNSTSPSAAPGQNATERLAIGGMIVAQALEAITPGAGFTALIDDQLYIGSYRGGCEYAFNKGTVNWSLVGTNIWFATAATLTPTGTQVGMIGNFLG